LGKLRTPAVDGWFSLDPEEPRLLGTRCRACGTVFFPRETIACRNPGCGDDRLDEVGLSRRGRLWSWTNSCYPPPAPYVTAEPFEPYVVAAVELEQERMVVLGQVMPGVDIAELRVGMEMELVLDVLYQDPDREFVVWKWRPAAGPPAGSTVGARA
jgi:hypothetical protein